MPLLLASARPLSLSLSCLRSDRLDSFQSDAFVMVVTGQNKAAMDSLGGDEFLKQRRRKLDMEPLDASCHDLFGNSAIVIQVFLGRNVEIKLVTVHRV